MAKSNAVKKEGNNRRLVKSIMRAKTIRVLSKCRIKLVIINAFGLSALDIEALNIIDTIVIG